MTINEDDFPRLKEIGYDPRSEPDDLYNCIAWAIGEKHRWWEPCDGRYWPGRKPGDRADYSISALLTACASVGFIECDGDLVANCAHEAGVQKIALYAEHDEEYLHAARQLKHGEWTSKVGPEDDIRHPSPYAMEEGIYGKVVKIMKRPYPDGAVLGDDETGPLKHP